MLKKICLPTSFTASVQRSIFCVVIPRVFSTKAICQKSIPSLVAVFSCLFSSISHPSPTGGEISSGIGAITQSDATTTVTQSSQQLSLDWQSFNILAHETVNFVQPSSTSVAVNRILDTNGTRILGQLNATGQLYLINPNGILFGQGSQVSASGLIASALDLNNADFSGNSQTFSGNGSGGVINQGNLIAGNHGYVALLGNTVKNQGTIKAPKGSVVLGAGNTATLIFQDSSLLQIEVDESTLNSLALNGGLIQADGGRVLIAAGAKHSLLTSMVNNTGVIEARTLENRNGSIFLLAGMAAGTASISGTLDASAPNEGDGGFIETSAAQVKISDNVNVTTLATVGDSGTWLIDPSDFNIGNASDGAVSNMSANALESSLSSSNVTILSSGGTADGAGDINVNEAVSWNANQLTLTAARDININAVMAASGSSTLVLNTATANGSDSADTDGQVYVGMNFDGFRGRVDFANSGLGLLTINSASYNVINSLSQLQSMAITGNFALGANLGTLGSNFSFTPITSFANKFNGLGHTITGMNIAGAAAANTGLIKIAGAASDIRNVGLVGGIVSGGGAGTGGLIGSGTTGVLSNNYNTGNVSGAAGTGGLAGSMTTGSISNSFTSGVTIGAAGAGGLVGSMTTGSVINSYAIGNVTGAAGTGGLVGTSTGLISGSHATGVVNGDAGTGGLVGTTTGNTVKSYATSNVTGKAGTGGLIGTSTGAVTNNYAAGTLTGAANTGGVLGSSTGVLTNNFWDIANSAYGVGSTTPAGTYSVTRTELIASGFPTTTANSGSGSAWDFNATWLLVAGSSPILRGSLPKLVVSALNQSSTYTGVTGYTLVRSGLEYSLDLNTSEETYLNGLGVTNTGTSNGAKDTGTYAISALYSGQTHYDISYVNGALTINPAGLLVTASAQSTVYGATTLVFDGTEFGSSGLQNSEAITASIASSVTNASNVAVYTGEISAATATDSGAGTFKASNYTITYAAGIHTVVQKALTAVATAANKAYDGNTTASSTLTLSGLIGSETLTTSGVGSTFNDKDVADAATVTINSSTLVNGTDGNGGFAANYSLATGQTDSAVIIAKALIIKANNITQISGVASTFDGTEFTVVGLVNSESIGSVTLSTSVDENFQVGTYTDVVNASSATGGTFTTGNYQISYVDGNYDVIDLRLLFATLPSSTLQPSTTVLSQSIIGNSLVKLLTNEVIQSAESGGTNSESEENTESGENDSIDSENEEDTESAESDNTDSESEENTEPGENDGTDSENEADKKSAKSDSADSENEADTEPAESDSTDSDNEEDTKPLESNGTDSKNEEKTKSVQNESTEPENGKSTEPDPVANLSSSTVQALSAELSTSTIGNSGVQQLPNKLIGSAEPSGTGSEDAKDTECENKATVLLDLDEFC